MGELNLFANARDEIGACAEITVHQRLRDAHPIGERLDRDTHALFRENIDGRIEQFSPALLGRKIALATALGPWGPLGGIVRLSTLHGACLARKTRRGNVCLGPAIPCSASKSSTSQKLKREPEIKPGSPDG
jgi:hypothetical protein